MTAYDGHAPTSVGKLRGALGANLAPADRGLDDPLTEDSFVGLASLVTAQFGFTAEQRGADGNDITVEIVAPAAINQTLSVGVTGTAITVNLATDGAENLTSTVAQVVAALEGDVGAAALISVVALVAGTEIADALALSSLEGGDAEYSGLAAFQGGWPRHDGSRS